MWSSTLIYLIKRLWALPLSLVGLLVCLVCKPKGLFVARNRGCIHIRVQRLIPNWTAGQCFGHVVLLKYLFNKRLIQHEHRHVTQCEWLGPLIIGLYPLASLVSWISGQGFYSGNWFERDARKNADKEPTT